LRSIVVLLSLLLFSAACLGSGGSQSTPSAPEPGEWNMGVVWHVDTSDMPVMDLAPDGSLAAAIDYLGHRLYLVRPDGSSVSFDLKEPEDIVEPVVFGVALVNDKAHVLGSYAEFSGLRIYSWSGKTGETHEGGAGAVADGILRSPKPHVLPRNPRPNLSNPRLRRR